MLDTPEVHLVRAFLQYVVSCVVEGEFYKLEELGMIGSDVDRIMNMDLVDMENMSRSKHMFLSLDFDAAIFQNKMSRIDLAREEREVIDYLILNDAPQPMLHAFYGMNTKIYSKHRKKNGLSSAGGRPGAATPEEEKAIWNAYEGIGDKPALSQLEVAHYISIFNDTKISFRIIWSLIQSWVTDGL